MTWISTNITNIYLASIKFGTLQHLCNTLYKSQRIPTVLGILPYAITSNNRSPKSMIGFSSPLEQIWHRTGLTFASVGALNSCALIQSNCCTNHMAPKAPEVPHSASRGAGLHGLVDELEQQSLYFDYSIVVHPCFRTAPSISPSTNPSFDLSLVPPWHKLLSVAKRVSLCIAICVLIQPHENAHSTPY
jgi:hypothetical protein